MSAPPQQVGLAEAGGGAGERAVAVQLHPGDRQPVVAESSVDAERTEFVDQARQHQRVHAQSQPATAVQLQVGAHLAQRDLRIDDRGDARGVELALCGLQVRDQLARIAADMEVRAVAPDLDPFGAGEHVGGRVPHLAGEVAVLVAAEMPAVGIGGAGGDLRLSQRVAVDDRAVAAGMEHHDRAIGGDPVQVVAGEHALFGDIAVMETLTPHGLSRFEPTGSGPQPLDDAVDIGCVHPAAVHPIGELAIHQWMTVGIDEPGQQCGAVQVHHLRIGQRGPAAVHERADGGDDAVPHQDRFGAVLLGGHGDDLTAVEQQLGRADRGLRHEFPSLRQRRGHCDPGRLLSLHRTSPQGVCRTVRNHPIPGCGARVRGVIAPTRSSGRNDPTT